MGGSSSSTTRKVSLEQDSEGGVVKVSEDVLQRMFGEESSRSTGDDSSTSRTQSFPRGSDQRWKTRMDELEDHYREKLKQAEEKSAAFYRLTAEQFQNAADEVEAKFMKQRFVPVCENLQNEVLKCYADNPKQTLNCAHEVKAFNSCVDQTRMNVLLRRSVDVAS